MAIRRNGFRRNGHKPSVPGTTRSQNLASHCTGRKNTLGSLNLNIIPLKLLYEKNFTFNTMKIKSVEFMLNALILVLVYSTVYS
jgi:hypothetical protein